jgi:putative monooxygenase
MELAVECVISGHCDLSLATLPRIALREFVSAKCGATGLSTGTATFEPGARMPYHKHTFSEAVTILVGGASTTVEGRKYLLRPFDCIHVPAGMAHEVENVSANAVLVAHWAFATSVPSRESLEDRFVVENRGLGSPLPGDSEHIVRFADAQKYELADGTQFCDLFAGRFGAVGICGGYGKFNPDCSLPCHVHEYDESISIVAGEATCEVMGKRYRLSNCDTAFVPRGRAHRFLNESESPMAMVWVYAGSEPERTILDVRYCDGSLLWKNERRDQDCSKSC